jgi:hypothetical protein
VVSQQSHFRFFPVIAGVVAVAAITAILSLARPHCEDGTLKTVLVSGVFLGQWLLVAPCVGYAARTNGVIHGLVFGITGAVLTGAIWLIGLWGWRAFTWQFYWWVTGPPALVIIPLSVLGVWFGGYWFRRKRTLA